MCTPGVRFTPTTSSSILVDSRNIFTVGGTVQAGHGRYVPRKVDAVLLDLCRSGRFAFVLSARQVGKSSLMVNTAEKLAAEGVRSLIIDLSQIGVHVTPDEWYASLLTRAEDSLYLDLDAQEWWESRSGLTYAQRLTSFFEDVLLAEIDSPIVVFIDEIDSTLDLPFTDDFFAAIRYTYNARSRVKAFNRLSFVLLGVATPNDLISDPRRTPFNIGTEVDVDYFTVDEAMLLSEGLSVDPEMARRVMGWVLKWTGGHPYLTQLLCSAIAERRPDQLSEARVDGLVDELFLRKRSQKDANLRFVNDMLTRWAPDRTAVLSHYRRILRGRRVEDDRQSPILSHLKLSGVVGKSNGTLRVSTKIYSSVFDRTWVRRQWPEHWIKRVPPLVIGLIVALFAATVLLALFVIQTQRTTQAQERSELQTLLNERLLAEIAVSDSLRMVAEDASRRLSAQVRVSDSLRFGTESINDLLINQVRVSDSLRRATEVSNSRIKDQALASDSLRETAEARLAEVRQARRQTITIALTEKSRRQLRVGDFQLAGLLARQAHFFNKAANDEFADPVYNALSSALVELRDNGETEAGGSAIISTFNGGVRSVVVSHDDRWYAAGIDDGSVWLHDRRTSVTITIPAHESSVRAVAFSNDGLLASASDDSRVVLWSRLDDAEPLGMSIGNHPGSVRAIRFTSDSEYVVTAGEAGEVSIWTVADPLADPVARLQTHNGIRAVGLTPDGGTVVFSDDAGNLTAWRWNDEVASKTTWPSGQRRANAIDFDPAGNLLAVGGDVPSIRVWEFHPDQFDFELLYDLVGHEGPVNSVAFSKDGSTLASGSADQSVLLWKVSRPKQSPILLRDHKAWIWSVAFAQNGNRLISGSADATIRIWTIDADQLSSEICRLVDGRELTFSEWTQFIGTDFSYDEHYQPCGSTAGLETEAVGDQ